MNRRVGIEFGDETPPLDVSDFAPRSPNGPSSPEIVRDLGESEGFRNRGGTRRHWSRRTGRTAQLNVKLKPETRNEIYAIADANRWGVGETIERLLEAFHDRERP